MVQECNLREKANEYSHPKTKNDIANNNLHTDITESGKIMKKFILLKSLNQEEIM